MNYGKNRKAQSCRVKVSSIKLTLPTSNIYVILHPLAFKDFFLFYTLNIEHFCMRLSFCPLFVQHLADKVLVDGWYTWAICLHKEEVSLIKKHLVSLIKKHLANLLFIKGGVLGHFGGNRRGAYSGLYFYSSNSKKLEKYYHRCTKPSQFSACYMWTLVGISISQKVISYKKRKSLLTLPVIEYIGVFFGLGIFSFPSGNAQTFIMERQAGTSLTASKDALAWRWRIWQIYCVHICPQ